LHNLISSREAADRLGVSQATVLRAVARGTLTPAKTTPGGHHRFRLDAIEALAGAPSPDLGPVTTFISTGGAARLLAVSQHTVIRACRDGRLKPDETTPGGHLRFSEERIRRLAPLANELKGTGETARVLGLTAGRLRRAVHDGTVTPATVTPGGHRRFAATDLVSTAFPSGRGRKTNSNDEADHAAT
jgi:excisionase family DNA binding protein